MRAYRRSSGIRSCAFRFVFIPIMLILFWSTGAGAADISSRYTEWPRFGLAFQAIKDYDLAARRFHFWWGKMEVAEQLARRNNQGIYLQCYNIYAIVPFGSNIFCPDYDDIVLHHPDWLLRYKDGTPAVEGKGREAWTNVDFANPDYVTYAIDWLRRRAFGGGKYLPRDLGLDNGFFGYGSSKWAKYDTSASNQDAWEYHLRRLSEAFRPQHKIIFNVGSCDLATYARMVRWIDGTISEGLYHTYKEGKIPLMRQDILDKLAKGQWCAENDKVWAVRHLATIKALSFTTDPGAPPRYLTVGDREIIVFGPGQQVLGKIFLDGEDANTLAKLADNLKKFNLNVAVINPYPEASSLETFQRLTYAKVENGQILKLKQAPKEAFLFGYAVVLMAAGKNAYFILGDETFQEYYYPEMDWALGAPRGKMAEVAPQVFKREFKKITAYLNLSENPFRLPDSRLLLPGRGALLKTPGR